MEAAVRCLRDAVAPDETACCLVLVADDARVDGEEGMETFSSLLREHADAAAAGRAHARRTVLVAGARAPRRHRLEARARPELRGAHSRDGDALAVVDLTRDPYGWLVSIGAEPSRDGSVRESAATASAATASAATNETATRNRTAPRLGDVASIAAAVHDALGGDAAREHDERDDAERDDDARDESGVSRGVSVSLKKKNENENENAKPRGRRSGLWGRAPRERARSVVALDCVAELVHASGVANTLELIERIRADTRVCGVVAYARGGGGDFGENDFSLSVKKKTQVGPDAFARVASSLRRAASCAVSVAPPRATAEALADIRRRRTVNATHGVLVGASDDDASFPEEADALHALASTLEGGLENGFQTAPSVARLFAFLSRPTGRTRVERRDVDVRFRFPVPGADGTESGNARPSSPVLEVSFSAPERAESAARGGARDDGDTRGETFQSEKDVASKKKIEAEAEAEKRRVRLERATPFKLGVSAEESLARSRVVLPFEHQGGYARGPDPDATGVFSGASAETYDRGDFLRYLPRDAGGESGVAGGGHGEAREKKSAGGGVIVYARDSEDDGSGSKPDSDEELDEDADF